MPSTLNNMYLVLKLEWFLSRTWFLGWFSCSSRSTLPSPFPQTLCPWTWAQQVLQPSNRPLVGFGCPAPTKVKVNCESWSQGSGSAWVLVRHLGRVRTDTAVKQHPQRLDVLTQWASVLERLLAWQQWPSRDKVGFRQARSWAGSPMREGAEPSRTHWLGCGGDFCCDSRLFSISVSPQPLFSNSLPGAWVCSQPGSAQHLVDSLGPGDQTPRLGAPRDFSSGLSLISSGSSLAPLLHLDW
jgi:hypothetical protein